MKRLISLFLILAGTTLLHAAPLDRYIPVSTEKLPQKAQNFISRYFKATTIDQVMKEANDFTPDYIVTLSDNTQIKFESGGTDWDEIINPSGKKLPEGILPEQIVSYIDKRYPDAKILNIEKDRKSYEIDLSSGFTLEFDREGRFIRIDH